MDRGSTIKPVPSNNTPNLSRSAGSFSSTNPYQRDPSRRAIACVTCAKAKTRCDKSLPSCSRCISKGIKCDPRSTRRTTDNNYRTLPTKKPFVTPKHFPRPGVLRSSSDFSSTRSIPSSRPRLMRAPSSIDFRTAVKMQQAATMSGAPKLTPLPTYHNQVVDECYAYTPSPEPDLRYTPEIEQDSFPFSRGGTPQTPQQPFGCADPLPAVEDMSYLHCPPWAGENLVPVGLGFVDMDMSMGCDSSWMTPTPEPEDMAQANLFAQSAHNAFDAALAATPWSAFPQQQGSVSPEAKALDPIDSGIVMQGEWPQHQYQRQDVFVDMGNMVTSAPYVPKMQSMPGSSAPVWEDVFMPSSLPY